MKKVNIENLVIEGTRRCNMRCRHCLNGPAQNLDIKKSYIENLIKQVNYISSVTFSGGEPSLYPKAIEDFVRLINKYKVSLGYFYIATNGKNIKEDFILAVIKVYSICEEKECCVIEISKDDFHKEFGDYNPELLKAFSFVSTRGDHKGLSDMIWLNEGRFRKLRLRNVKETKPDQFMIEKYPKEITISDGVIHLNTKGNLIAGCNFSFKNQEKKENIICSSKESIYDNIQKFEYTEA